MNEMRSKQPVMIDMTVEGSFRPEPSFSGTWPVRIGIGAAIIAFGAGTVALASVFLWIASMLLPVAIVAGAVAYAAFKIQARRKAR